ncbi:hypothetical protein GCU56_18350 [Geodermatophilus sabuli]|uniref:Uncharacterized protein n=1 Tax=Geodermatophilus sabuli TaxID=1564158 RepID=A0A7K3W554_9ACTN|nr:hypothetical protein [Geodermatophilus sabuli]NEK59820.1 hypothetical protein [Geodermatophilus sabuli]
MTDPQGSDRIQQDVPTASGTGDDSSTGTGFDDVPLTREEAVERDAAQDDEQPARPGSDVSLSQRAQPPGGAQASDPRREGAP